MNFDFSKLEGFNWDEGNLEHILKHNIDFRECEEVFFNKPLLISEDIIHSQLEERYQALGRSNNGSLIFLVFTIRNNKIRVVSARKQNKKERKKIVRMGGE